VGFLVVLFSSKYLTPIQIFEFAKILGSIGTAFLDPFRVPPNHPGQTKNRIETSMVLAWDPP